MRLVDLTLQAPASAGQTGGQPAATCELALLGKDGIWLMQVGVVYASLFTAAAALGAQTAAPAMLLSCGQLGSHMLMSAACHGPCCQLAGCWTDADHPSAPSAVQIPRSVPHMLLTAAGRADVLVRCTGPPGAQVCIVLANDASTGCCSS